MREDGTVTRSAEVMSSICVLFVCLFICLSCLTLPPLLMKYVGSFPVDDLCLDEQIVHLNTELKAHKVRPHPPVCIQVCFQVPSLHIKNAVSSRRRAGGGGPFPSNSPPKGLKYTMRMKRQAFVFLVLFCFFFIPDCL